MISLVAAVADGGVIGNGGSLPWRLPADLAHFRALTMGHTLIAGRKTFQSIGRPLDGRRMIVMSRDPAFRSALRGAQAASVCIPASSAEEALELAGSDECFVIGGASVYARFLPLASFLFITRIHAPVKGDAFFPPIEEREWILAGQRPGVVDAANPLPHEFLTYERRPI